MSEIPDIKPFVSPVVPARKRNVFDEDYIPYDTPVKQEPGTSTAPSHTVIGHLTDQPDEIAKAVKQELIDSTVKDIADKHSSSCALNVFVQECGGASGFRIEDVQSLISADSGYAASTHTLHTASRLQTARRGRRNSSNTGIVHTPMVTTTTIPTIEPLPVVMSIDQSIYSTSMPTTQSTLHMEMSSTPTVTTAASILHVVMPHLQTGNMPSTSSTATPALCVVTKPTVSATTTISSPATLTMQTDDSSIISICTGNKPALSMVSHDTLTVNTPTTSDVLTTPDTSQALPVVTAPNKSSEAKEPTDTNVRWSRILNRMVKTTTDKPEHDPEPLTEPSSTTTTTDEYFEVLTYEQDYIVHLSKNNIITHQPVVKLSKLTQAEISTSQEQASGADSGTSSSTYKSPPPKKTPLFPTKENTIQGKDQGLMYNKRQE